MVETRKLGASGVIVPTVCLGTMMFGGQTSEADSRAIIDDAVANGFNFIDTADVYTGGKSEEVVGRAIAARRDEVFLATKCGNRSGERAADLSRVWVTKACEASLRRLGTDRIDLYYLHREDHATPLVETVMAIGDLIRAGKILYFGVSNYRAWRVAEICNICDRHGIPRPIVSQPYYNAMNRMPEVEHLPACDAYGLGVVTYSPLARGVLTGKYLPDATPDPDSRAGRKDARMLQSEWRPESLRIAQDLKTHADARGVPPGHLAVRWVLNNRFVTGVIAGPRTMDQWRDYKAAVEAAFDAADEALFDRLVPEGHPSTPGYNDPAYPLEGRPRHV